MSGARLREEILRLSSSSDWEEARLEWSLLDVCEVPDGAACLCGHHPVHDLCRLGNNSTGEQALVGNCCVKRFMSLPSGPIFSGMKRIGADAGASMGPVALDMAIRNGWVAPWEGALYQLASRKQACSEAQAAKKAEINRRVLDKIRSGGAAAAGASIDPPSAP